MKTGGALALVSSGVIKRPKKAYAEEDVGVGAGAVDGPLGDLAIVAIEEGLTGVAAVHVEEDVILVAKIEELGNTEHFTAPGAARPVDGEADHAVEMRVGESVDEDAVNGGEDDRSESASTARTVKRRSLSKFRRAKRRSCQRVPTRLAIAHLVVRSYTETLR